MNGTLAHFLPKYATLLIGVLFFPYTRAALVPFLNGVVGISLVLHALAPNKAPSKPAVMTKDIGVMALNLFLTSLWTTLFVHAAWDYLDDVDCLASVPITQWLYPFAWIISDEVLFFFIHRFAHKPGVYAKCHKMHHKFKVTNAWTSFYSHPVDHSVAVIGAGLALPLLMTAGMGIRVAVPVVALFNGGAIVTFIASHHATKNESCKAVGTDHLIHHQQFTVNYGNFGYIDRISGTYRTAENAAKGWLKIPGVGTLL